MERVVPHPKSSSYDCGVAEQSLGVRPPSHDAALVLGNRTSLSVGFSCMKC